MIRGGRDHGGGEGDRFWETYRTSLQNSGASVLFGLVGLVLQPTSFLAMISCSRRSSCGGRGGARHSWRSCVSSCCSSPTSRVRSLDQGGLKGSENSGTYL